MYTARRLPCEVYTARMRSCHWSHKGFTRYRVVADTCTG